MIKRQAIIRLFNLMLICTTVSLAQSIPVATALGEFKLQRLGGYAAGQAYYVQLIEDGASIIAERLGRRKLEGWTIILTADPGSIATIAGNGLPEWIPAVALPQRKTIVMLVPGAGMPPIERNRFEITLLHELTHAYSFAAVMPATFASIPDWYIEGLAGYISGEAYEGQFYALVRGGFHGLIRPLEQLDMSKLLRPTERSLAYAQAYFAMLLLAELYGADIHLVILGELSQGANFAQAFINSIGDAPSVFNQQYLTLLKERYNPWIWLTNPSFLFALFPLIVFVAFVIRRLRMKRQLAILAQQDQLVMSGDWPGELAEKVEQILARPKDRKKN